MLPLGIIIKVAIVIILIGGSTLISTGKSSLACLTNQSECGNVLMILGESLISPQNQIVKNVNSLESDYIREIPQEYRGAFIGNLQHGIYIAILVSCLWIYIGWKIMSKLTVAQDAITKLVVFGFVLLALGMIQSMYSYVTTGIFTMPWFGFVKLILHSHVLSF